MNHAILKSEFDAWMVRTGKADIVSRIKEEVRKLDIAELREEKVRAESNQESYWTVVHSAIHMTAQERDYPPFWTDKAKYDDDDYREFYYTMRKKS